MKFRDRKGRGGRQRRGQMDGELVLNGDRVSVSQDERVREIGVVTVAQ